MTPTTSHSTWREPRTLAAGLIGVSRALTVAMVLAVATACGGGSGSSAATRSGTVAGRVLSAPGCPVERAGTPCPPRPVEGATVTALQDNREVASATTDRLGGFRLSLAAGHYLVVARN